MWNFETPTWKKNFSCFRLVETPHNENPLAHHRHQSHHNLHAYTSASVSPFPTSQPHQVWVPISKMALSQNLKLKASISDGQNSDSWIDEKVY